MDGWVNHYLRRVVQWNHCEQLLLLLSPLLTVHWHLSVVPKLRRHCLGGQSGTSRSSTVANIQSSLNAITQQQTMQTTVHIIGLNTLMILSTLLIQYLDIIYTRPHNQIPFKNVHNEDAVSPTTSTLSNTRKFTWYIFDVNFTISAISYKYTNTCIKKIKL